MARHSRKRAQTLVSDKSPAPAVEPVPEPEPSVEVVDELSVDVTFEEHEVEERYALFTNPGPRTYRGDLLRRGILPVHGNVSLPLSSHEAARAAGLEFVRWAK